MGGDGDKVQAEFAQELNEVINTKCYKKEWVNIFTEFGFQTKHTINMKNLKGTNYMSINIFGSHVFIAKLSVKLEVL